MSRGNLDWHRVAHALDLLHGSFTDAGMPVPFIGIQDRGTMLDLKMQLKPWVPFRVDRAEAGFFIADVQIKEAE